jgi:hypothetical protein
VGYRPIPRVPARRRSPTSLELVQEQYVRGERDLAGLERGVAWLLLHRLDESYQPIAARWPPADPDALPVAADPSLVYDSQFPRPAMQEIGRPPLAVRIRPR